MLADLARGRHPVAKGQDKSAVSGPTVPIIRPTQGRQGLSKLGRVWKIMSVILKTGAVTTAGSGSLMTLIAPGSREPGRRRI